MKAAAIIVASGSSQRMGFDKLAADWQGQPVLWHSTRAFSSLAEICQVVVVTPEERFHWLDDLGTKLVRADGGAERPDSVAAGLAALHPEITHVAIHDGARPCVSADAILKVFTAAEQHGAAALARRVTETLKRASTNHFTTDAVSRDELWIMETPQAFERSLICQAYESISAGDASITDEVSALQRLGHATYLVENLSPNPKITTAVDLEALRR